MHEGRLHASLGGSRDEGQGLLHSFDDDDDDNVNDEGEAEVRDGIDGEEDWPSPSAGRVRDLIFADAEWSGSLENPRGFGSHNSDEAPDLKENDTPADYGYRLLDRALEDVTGKFQALLTVLCALVNFVDAAETMMMGLLYPSLMQEFGLTEQQLALMPSLTNVGMLVGALVFGNLSDSVGRRKTLIASLAICALFGFLSSFAQNIISLSILRMTLGFGYGGNIVTSTTLLVEFLAHEERGVYTMWCGVGFGVGALSIAGLSWAVVPYLGWRWLIRLAALVSVPVLVMLIFVPESPRFFIMRHQYYECVKAVDFVANFNGKALPRYFNAATLNVMHHDRRRHESARNCFGYGDIMRAPVLVTLIPLAGCWFLNAFASVLSAWIPIHARRFFPDSTNIVYTIALVQASGILAGTLLQVFMVRHFGRRIQMRVGFLLSALCLLLLGFFSYVSLGALFALAFAIQLTEQVIIMTLYLYTPEAFPTAVRVTSFGICQAHHRFAPIVAPFVVASLDHYGFNVTCFVFSGVFCIGAVLAMMLRVSTFNTPLVEESDLAARRHSFNTSAFTRNPQDPEFDSAPSDNAFWKTRALAELGLYKETFAKHRLEAARDAVAKGLQDAKKPKVVVGLGLVECEVLALSGAYEACVAKYKSFFLEYPTFVEDSSLRIKAAQAYRRCDLVDECTDLLQEVMDDPPAPYEEADILLILGVCYEYAGTRDGKRMGKEAFKHAFKKAREAGKVKFASTEESSGADPRSPGVSPGDATGQPQLDLLHSPLKQQPKHITFAEWKADPETWTSLAARCRACGDLVFALDFYTKGLWTESGQQDPALWMQFAELSYVMGEVDAAVQACATLYYMQPFDLSLRARLGMWDPQGWGAHIALEEATITKVQALLRGRWGRRYAAEHKPTEIANILQTNETVTEIGLGAGSELGVLGTTAIAEMMRCHNFRFRRLMIDEQPELQDEGTLPIVKAVGDFFFGRYSRLEELSLRNTGLGDVAVIALVEGLELNTKLRRLHLEQNRIRDAGAAALGAIFPRNETLEELDLRDNRIASEGAATLVRALQSTCAGVKAVRGLHLLRLDANFITTCGGSAIIRCLRASRKHRRVLRITASANPFGSRLHEEIREYMGSNKASSHLLPEVRNPLTSASAACAFVSEGPDDEADPASDVAGEDGANPRLQIQGPPFSRPSKALLQLGPVKKPRSRTSPYLSQPWALRSVKAHPQASLRPRGAFAA
ncbi:Solute carrier family 22 member 1 [Hondaea fermentalgiana]|uniref:Solute carrier family 22 member 1 n=1 Tax=Hondaea fermentalgiana TaxID=2315210 RepID=A0A2R5GEP9_9STRA|nr:Solute carrier family 22 member 1 [Hondaea fermentalgiana]|eukprot:GBG28779.1 Solute carrier family 22 member 1 [Hondaea fermentalgiana]